MGTKIEGASQGVVIVFCGGPRGEIDLYQGKRAVGERSAGVCDFKNGSRF